MGTISGNSSNPIENSLPNNSLGFWPQGHLTSDEQVCHSVQKILQETLQKKPHGPVFKTHIQLDGSSHSIFVKPLIDSERANFLFLQKHATKDLHHFFPHFYGTIELGGKVYMVLDDVKEAQPGQSKREVANLTLSGKGVIYGKKGFHLQRQFSKLTERFTPSFVLNRKGNELLRQLFSLLSERILANVVSKSAKAQQTDAKKNVEGLKKQLQALEKALSQSPIAFINVRLVVLQDKNSGTFSIKLTDPIHAQAQQNYEIPAGVSVYTGKAKTGNPVSDRQAIAGEFQAHKDATTQSLRAIQGVLKELESCLSRKNSAEVGKSRLTTALDRLSETIQSNFRKKITSVRKEVSSHLKEVFSEVAKRERTPSSKDFRSSVDEMKIVQNIARLHVQAFGSEGNTLYGFDKANFGIYLEVLNNAHALTPTSEFLQEVELVSTLSTICDRLHEAGIKDLYGANGRLTQGDVSVKRILNNHRELQTLDQKRALELAEIELLPLVKKIQELDATCMASTSISISGGSDTMRGSAESVLLEVQQLLGKVDLEKTQASAIIFA